MDRCFKVIRHQCRLQPNEAGFKGDNRKEETIISTFQDSFGTVALLLLVCQFSVDFKPSVTWKFLKASEADFCIPLANDEAKLAESYSLRP